MLLEDKALREACLVAGFVPPGSMPTRPFQACCLNWAVAPLIVGYTFPTAGQPTGYSQSCTFHLHLSWWSSSLPLWESNGAFQSMGCSSPNLCWIFGSSWCCGLFCLGFHRRAPHLLSFIPSHPVSDRMPVILRTPSSIAAWLQPGAMGPSLVAHLCQPYNREDLVSG